MRTISEHIIFLLFRIYFIFHIYIVGIAMPTYCSGLFRLSLKMTFFNKKNEPVSKLVFQLFYAVLKIELLNNFVNNTSTNCVATFTDCKSHTFFDCNRSDKFNFHYNVITRHYHLTIEFD